METSGPTTIFCLGLKGQTNMGKKFKVWIDSGANAHSRCEQIVDLEGEYGITEEEWKRFSEAEKDEVMSDVAFSTITWGYEEIEP